MTELQELMLYTCVGAMSGMFIAEIIVIITSTVSLIRDRIHKRKETGKSGTKTD